MENQDYIRCRDYLLGIMRKQNVLMSKEMEDTTFETRPKRGKKPKPSKRIEASLNIKTYSPKKIKNKFG
jgi:hypothetical protein